MTSLKPEKRDAKDCPVCGGRGIVAVGRIVCECPRCNGWGWVPTDDEQVSKPK